MTLTIAVRRLIGAATLAAFVALYVVNDVAAWAVLTCLAGYMVRTKRRVAVDRA